MTVDVDMFGMLTRAKRETQADLPTSSQGQTGSASSTGVPSRQTAAAANRGRRKAARARAKAQMVATPGLSLLQASAVKKPTAQSYVIWTDKFLEWLAGPAPHQDATRMSKLLAAYFNELYFEGALVYEGTQTLAAILHRWPSLGRGNRTALPEARQALQGWSKLSPPHARLPLPWQLAAAVAHVLAEDGKPLMGLLTVLSFHGYLRPGVALALTHGQFTRPLKRRGRCKRAQGPEYCWALNLHRAEFEEPSKTGIFDETIEIADHEAWQWLGDCLAVAVTRSRAAKCREQRLVGFSMTQWTEAFASGMARLSFPRRQDAHLHRLRHGGASHDATHQLRTLDQIAKRGA